jgi:transposase
MKIATIGLDIAKSIFQVHGVDSTGRVVLRRKVSRAKVLDLFAGFEPCLVGMEACSTAHHWARELGKLGHHVKLMPAAYVKAYVKRDKNDAADAEAICEAVTRPTMRFVSVKPAETQAVLMLHRMRQLLVKQRTAQVNAIRGHLAEHGVIAAKGRAHVDDLVETLRDGTTSLPELVRHALLMVVSTMEVLNRQIAKIERELMAWHRTNAASRRLATIPGVGFITATALAATIADPKAFRSGRHFASWLGLVPKQHSSGGKDRMGRISKMGNIYLRQLLVVGATAIMRYAKLRHTTVTAWMCDMLERKPARLVTVAAANKMARIAWAVMAREQDYRAVPMAA